MKIRRTVKTHYFGSEDWPELKEAGKVEILNEEGMQRVIRMHGSLSASMNAPHRNVAECWEWFKQARKCETFSSTYEIIE